MSSSAATTHPPQTGGHLPLLASAFQAGSPVNTLPVVAPRLPMPPLEPPLLYPDLEAIPERDLSFDIVYSGGDPRQWIDFGLAPLPDGDYVLRQVVDPDNLLYESINKSDPERAGSRANEASVLRGEGDGPFAPLRMTEQVHPCSRSPDYPANCGNCEDGCFASSAWQTLN